nr:hypothetical protein CFP56_61533 [Quercus suber]
MFESEKEAHLVVPVGHEVVPVNHQKAASKCSLCSLNDDNDNTITTEHWIIRGLCFYLRGLEEWRKVLKEIRVGYGN